MKSIIMNKLAIIFVFFALISNSIAKSVPSTQEITKQVVRSVRAYANSISCGNTEVLSKNIATLVPYKSFYDRQKAKFAVLWPGDIGCIGGTGTGGTNISIVKIGAGDSFVVDPLRSSPVIKFYGIGARGFPEIIESTSNSIILEGFDYDPKGKDAMCCPSVAVRVTVRVDEKGNWKVISQP